ncbi:hypothetical protein MKX03_016908 [Papaver bracteatum]|nr:hypothetical protein MKX03_016908 [Papaver bracteatum]
MGCIHGKCCIRYPASSNADPEANRGDVDLNGTNNENGNNGNHHQSILTESKTFEIVNRGYYPDFPDKENQDSYVVKTGIQGNPNLHFFGVFDGHGQYGTQSSNFVKERLIEILENDTMLVEDPVKAYNSAFLAANSELHESEIDDTMSGTTAITVLVSADTVYVANVGDSRAVIAVKDGSGAIAEDLSIDQTPFRKDECERVKMCGARVLSANQVEGIKDPDIQNWGDEESDGGDHPRLWVQDGMYPGTTFTRSLGDSFAEKIGVIAVPEVKIIQLTPDHLFIVIASDGVFEFLSSQVVTDMVMKYADTWDACASITGESYKLWLHNENRTDDITIIIVRIKDLQNFTHSSFLLLISLVTMQSYFGTKGGSTKSVPQGMENGFSDSTDPEVCSLNKIMHLLFLILNHTLESAPTPPTLCHPFSV